MASVEYFLYIYVYLQLKPLLALAGRQPMLCLFTLLRISHFLSRFSFHCFATFGLTTLCRQMYIQTSTALCAKAHNANSNSYSKILIFSINLSIRIVKKIRCVYYQTPKSRLLQ